MRFIFYQKRKAQAALEFLTTYAWAILIILITIGALYYFGVFDFGSFGPQTCDFTSQFECVDFAFVNDEIRFRLLNNIGEEVFVESMNVSDDSINILTCTTPAPFTWQDDEEVDFVFSSCQNGALLSGEAAVVDVAFVYYAINTPSQPRHTVRGRIHAITR